MTTYNQLNDLFATWLNQDYDLIADSIEGVLAEYVKGNDLKTIIDLRADIASFMAQNKERLDQAFEEAYGFDFDPKLWGHSAKSVLMLVDAILLQACH
jgi:hypothetical protein